MRLLKMIKLISKLEYEVITARYLSFVDTFHPEKYVIGEVVTLRCYFAKRLEPTATELLVRIENVVIVSMNEYSKITLYRVHFSLLS